MVNVLRKKIVKMGTSNGFVIDAKWLHANRLKTGDEVQVIVDSNYILIRDRKDLFLNDMLEREIEALYQLNYEREQIIEEVRRKIAVDKKELDEGRLEHFQSVDDKPPYADTLAEDIRKAKEKFRNDNDDKKSSVTKTNGSS